MILHMPHVNGTRWLHRRCELVMTRSQAAEELGISEGYLRNIEGGHAYPGLELVYRAAALYKKSFRWLTDQSDGVPDEPPSKEQEHETNTGPGREGGNKGRGGKDPKGPKRLKGVAA